MNPRTEANLNRMSDEMHFLTSPIRWIVDFLKFVVIFCMSVCAIPFIVVGLIAHYAITGHSFLDADAILILKILYTFCAPVITTVAYRFCQAVSGRRATVKATYEFSMHKVFLITLGLMLAGALLAFQAWSDMSSDRGLVALVVYLSSPLALLFVKRRGPDAVRASREPRVW